MSRENGSDIDDSNFVFRSHASARRIHLLWNCCCGCRLAVLKDPATRGHSGSRSLRDWAGFDTPCCLDAPRFLQFARGGLYGSRPLSAISGSRKSCSFCRAFRGKCSSARWKATGSPAGHPSRRFALHWVLYSWSYFVRKPAATFRKMLQKRVKRKLLHELGFCIKGCANIIRLSPLLDAPGAFSRPGHDPQLQR